LASVELEVAFVKVEAASSPAPGQCSSVRSPVSERDCLVLEAQVPLGVVRALDPVVGPVLVGTPRLHGNLFEHTERSSSFNMSGSHGTHCSVPLEADVLVGGPVSVPHQGLRALGEARQGGQPELWPRAGADLYHKLSF